MARWIVEDNNAQMDWSAALDDRMLSHFECGQEGFRNDNP
jgi:hypothetical protein